MSAIFGIVAANPEPLSFLSAMSSKLHHRGNDGERVYGENGVALGNRLNQTLPECGGASAERPGHPRGNFITSDSRLDNREELLSRLGLLSPESTDAELIHGAYEKWGRGCVDYLEGDFAFAIWDRKERILFAARDRFGVKPFCYAVGAEAFVFGSEIKALFACPWITRTVNEAAVGRFLLGMPGSSAETFFKGIQRLPAGHVLTCTDTQVKVQRYWKLETPDQVELGSDAAYAEAMHAHLHSAVARRLRTKVPIGAMLSGGLDSSSIAWLAGNGAGEQRPLLPTFSNVFKEVPQCDEREYIERMVSAGGLFPHYCPGDQSGPLCELDRMLAQQDGPFTAPGLYLNCRLNAAAQEQGVRVLLDGHGGDEAVSLGHHIPRELAREGHLLELWQESKGLAETYKDSATKIFRGYLRNYPPCAAVVETGAARWGRRVAKRMLQRGTGRTAPGIKWLAVLKPLLRRGGLREEYQAFLAERERTGSSERAHHLNVLSSPAQACALETLDRSAAAYGIEPRFPFVDRELIQFCLSLPRSQKLHHGWNRVVLRRAMKGLPPEVRWRKQKTDLAPNFRRGLQQFNKPLLQSIYQEESSGAAGYLDTLLLKDAFQRFLAEGSDFSWRDTLMIWNIALVIRWLKQN
jgi:asparagine synthase (glutamine-hydrolysing)